MSRTRNIVIVGGGFAGTTLAKSLQRDLQGGYRVVLVSEETVSFGEIFAGVLKDAGRAQIVGQTTLGNVEILHGYDLADDSVLWIAEESFLAANSNESWEVSGIVPDVEAYADWDTFTFDDDPSIQAAVQLLGH